MFPHGRSKGAAQLPALLLSPGILFQALLVTDTGGYAASSCSAVPELEVMGAAALGHSHPSGVATCQSWGSTTLRWYQCMEALASGG